MTKSYYVCLTRLTKKCEPVYINTANITMIAPWESGSSVVWLLDGTNIIVEGVPESIVGKIQIVETP